MPLLLHIETATEICSVCVASDGKLLGIKENNEKNSHAALVHVLTDDLLKMLGISYDQLDGIAVSMGPGSYTGLRIGIAAAKGYCFSIDKPLLAINTLEIMTNWYLQQHPVFSDKPENILLCPMIDARRMEVYTALMNTSSEFIDHTKALILDESSFADRLSGKTIHFFGNVAEKFGNMIREKKNAVFTKNFSTSSAGMVLPAYNAYLAREFRDPAYFEPYYLKDFITTSPRS